MSLCCTVDYKWVTVMGGIKSIKVFKNKLYNCIVTYYKN